MVKFHEFYECSSPTEEPVAEMLLTPGFSEAPANLEFPLAPRTRLYRYMEDRKMGYLCVRSINGYPCEL